MGTVIKLRVLLDHDEVDVFRDILISGEATFEDLHNCIQDCFGFDNQHMASFFLSNEHWDKGQEITLMDMGDSAVPAMRYTYLNSLVEQAGQKLVYVFDFFLMWCFFVEIISIGPEDENVLYPKIVMRLGANPDQYDKEPPAQNGSIESAQMYSPPEMENGETTALEHLFADFDDLTRYN